MSSGRRKTITGLTSKHRAQLTALAHELDPVVRIGQGGITDAVVQSVEDAFNRRELLKVKVLDGSPETPREAALKLADGIEGALVVRSVGRVAILYRPHPENPRIRLID